MSQPFFHEELEVKQTLINLARKFHRESREEEGSLERELAAALLYMNLADYLAEYLVTGLDLLSKESLGKYYLGVISFAPSRPKMTLEKSIRILEQYEFPQKPQALIILKAIKDARNKLAHEMFKTQAQELAKYDEAEHKLVVETERLISIIDEISSGLPPRNLLEKLEANPARVQEEAKQEVVSNSSTKKARS